MRLETVNYAALHRVLFQGRERIEVVFRKWGKQGYQCVLILLHFFSTWEKQQHTPEEAREGEI